MFLLFLQFFLIFYFFYNDTATTEIYTLSLHDALPISDGGVHSSLWHLEALIEQAHAAGARDVVVHAFTDGRDTLPESGAGFLARLDANPQARVGSVIGRYWAMDRDRRWERTQRAYDLLVHGRAEHHAHSGEQAVLDAYTRGQTDEFIEPTLVGEEARIRPALDS